MNKKIFFKKNIYKNYNNKSYYFLLKNLILFFFSIINIFRIALKKDIILANYFIIKKNKNLIDSRSILYLSKTKLARRANFVKSEDFKTSIKVFFYYPNIIFIYSLKYIIDFFLNFKIKKKNIRNYNNYFFFLVTKLVIKVLGIRKFFLIDDYRIMPFILSSCNELKIISVGYMHGKLSKYNLSHQYFNFNKFYVWSEFFKKKILSINKNYSKEDIIVDPKIKYTTKFLKKIRVKRDYKKINLLFLHDNDVKIYELIQILKELVKIKNINFFLKLRPNESYTSDIFDFCLVNKIRFFQKKNIYSLIFSKKINFLISSSSTMLLESSLMNIYPVLFSKKENSFAKELISERIVFPIYSLKNLYFKLLEIKKNKKKLDYIYNKVWA
jgi:hypothetical protein